jgi:hypothetical protein
VSKEIVKAGVRYNNIVYDGFNHGECFKKLPIDANMVDIEQGFITNDGEFVDRKKAFTIARKAHQLEYDYGVQKVLISEDIHINWLHKKDKTIADLEAKLAESEKQANDWKQRFESGEERLKTLNSNSVTALNLKNEKIEKLKQQLAEKEEIIDWQNEIVEGVKQEEELLAQKLKSLGVDCIEDLGKEHNQDKISFAVEQLRQVQKYIITDEKDMFGMPYLMKPSYVYDYIDNQIKQLKEMK